MHWSINSPKVSFTVCAGGAPWETGWLDPWGLGLWRTGSADHWPQEGPERRRTGAHRRQRGNRWKNESISLTLLQLPMVSSSEAPPGGEMWHDLSVFTSFATFTFIEVCGCVAKLLFYFFCCSSCSCCCYFTSFPIVLLNFVVFVIVLSACRRLQRLRPGHDGGGLLRHPGRSSVQQKNPHLEGHRPDRQLGLLLPPEFFSRINRKY